MVFKLVGLTFSCKIVLEANPNSSTVKHFDPWMWGRGRGWERMLSTASNGYEWPQRLRQPRAPHFIIKTETFLRIFTL
jgi:hypothetical protein